jgi:hypothetical protein
MVEAIDIARDAYEAITRFESDEKVQDTVQLLLGGNTIKLQLARGKQPFY